MPTPSSRTPVRVARGTYSNLNSSVADIQEGEICYATDQNKLYVKEGTSLESTQADVTSKAPIASPTFTGTPAGPTASTSTNTTQLATTAFVQQEITANAGPGLDDENLWTKGQRGEITTLTNSSGTVNIDFDASNNFYLSLGALVSNITFSNITLVNLEASLSTRPALIPLVAGLVLPSFLAAPLQPLRKLLANMTVSITRFMTLATYIWFGRVITDGSTTK